MKPETINLLRQLFEKYPILQAKAASKDEIAAAQDVLGVSFTDDYCEFLSLFGGAIVGAYPIYGLRRSELMDDHLWSVVNVTMYFRNQGWPSTDKWYVFSMDHAGNPIGTDGIGKILTYDHDAGRVIEIAQNFEEYILCCCIHAAGQQSASGSQ